MPQPYNLTNITAANNIYELGTATNNLTEGLFGLLILMSVFIITFAVSSRWGFKPAFATAAFVTAGIAVLIRLTNWIDDTPMYISFLLIGVAYLIMKFS